MTASAAGLAIDGTQATAAVTTRQGSPWWAVDLKQNYLVSQGESMCSAVQRSAVGGRV